MGGGFFACKSFSIASIQHNINYRIIRAYLFSQASGNGIIQIFNERLSSDNMAD